MIAHCPRWPLTARKNTALLPMAIGYARGSEANAPLGRAVVGGLLAGLATTLFVVPALYSLVVRAERAPAEHRPVGGALSHAA